MFSDFYIVKSVSSYFSGWRYLLSQSNANDFVDRSARFPTVTTGYKRFLFGLVLLPWSGFQLNVVEAKAVSKDTDNPMNQYKLLS